MYYCVFLLNSINSAYIDVNLFLADEKTMKFKYLIVKENIQIMVYLLIHFRFLCEQMIHEHLWLLKLVCVFFLLGT